MLNSRTDLTRRLRVKAGRTKFQAQQLLATNAVPLYRRVRSIDSPLAERIGDTERMAFVTYDELTGATDAVLSRLTNWLDLDSPLTPEYDLNNKSGSQSWGDPSQHIKAGAIIAVPPPSGDVDLDVVDQANTVYRTSCERLAALTTPVRQSAVAPEAR